MEPYVSYFFRLFSKISNIFVKSVHIMQEFVVSKYQEQNDMNITNHKCEVSGEIIGSDCEMSNGMLVIPIFLWVQSNGQFIYLNYSNWFFINSGWFDFKNKCFFWQFVDSANITLDDVTKYNLLTVVDAELNPFSTAFFIPGCKFTAPKQGNSDKVHSPGSTKLLAISHFLK